MSFVSSKKNKIAYAASVGKAELTNKQKKIFKEHLADFCGISVREESALQMVKEISPVKAEWVLDPTLLLSREEWDEICAPRAVDGKYVFCYFLGVDKNQEKTASDFAKKNNLKLTVIRNFQSGYLNDADKLQNVSPEKFVSLIKHAEYVFTDSFHATVFSNIYNKEYFVFERAGHKGMNSRIYSLIKLFGNEERFCDIPEKATLAYVEKIPKLSVANSSYFNKVKEESFNFLKRNLNKVKETIEKNEG